MQIILNNLVSTSQNTKTNRSMLFRKIVVSSGSYRKPTDKLYIQNAEVLSFEAEGTYVTSITVGKHISEVMYSTQRPPFRVASR
jgi:hypothetical protein